MLKIFCVHSKKHIYNFSSDDFKSIKHFQFFVDTVKPATKDIPEPLLGQEMRCPLCDKYFTSEKGILTDKGFLPK